MLRKKLVVIACCGYPVVGLACEYCPERLVLNRPALGCLEARAPELAERARRSDPAFVSLLDCEGAVVEMNGLRGGPTFPEPPALPTLPTLPSGSEPPLGESPAETVPSLVFFLSALQLTCFESRLRDLRTSDGGTVSIDFAVC